jgi:hypothetical protein
VKRSSVLLLVIVLVLISASYADFKLVRKIPAPDGCNLGLSKITGMAERRPEVGGVTLFVTSQCDMYMARSFLHNVRPGDGHVIWEDEFTLEPPNCGAEGPYLSSGEHYGADNYWLADECGEIMYVAWNKDALYIQDSFHPSGVDLPTGIVERNDTLWVVDRESDVLHVMDTDGFIYSTNYITFAYSLSALAMHDGNLFVASSSDSTRIFEMTTAGAYVDTHYVDGLAGMYPQSIAFIGDQLYIASTLDSIRVFEFLDAYREPTEPGDSVTIEVVPGEVTITFDSIVDSGYVDAVVYSTQPCPPPGGVEFFSQYYEITTTSSLDYVNELTFTDSSLADGTPTDLVRVFSRPSGGCGTWRDITTDSTEVLPTLRILGRTKSEDDEFSVFVLGLDNRDQYDVVRDKYNDVQGHIVSAEDSIPQAAYNSMLLVLGRSADDFNAGHYENAALKAENVAAIARAYPLIPHRYLPGEPGKNVAGRIISRANTLAFSYRFYPRWLAGVTVAEPAREPLLSVGPNPTGDAVQIEFAPVGRGAVEVAVYSVKGERVKTLYHGEPHSSPMTLVWDGNNERGVRVAAGMYFVVAREGERAATGKVVLQR